MKVRSRAEEKQEQHLTEPIEISTSRQPWKMLVLSADNLMRNFAVAGALLLTVIAVKNSSAPEAMSVFNAIQESAGMEWDESVGKLSFVNSWLPEEIQAVWSEKSTAEFSAPVKGEVVHAWSQAEPYLTIQSDISDVRAASDGEVMSIAHGLGEERIIRIRHADDTEAVYGNLQSCYVQVGDEVKTGDIIARLEEDKTLAFEWRVAGRSVDPGKQWMDGEE